MRKALWVVALAVSLSVGCYKSSPRTQPQIQTAEDSIRVAIQAHVAHTGTLNLQAFDTDVKQVTIQRDRAQAEVEFRVKDGPGAMELTYALEKHGGVWSVVESDPVGGNFSHPALDQGQSAAINRPTGTNRSLAETLRGFGIDASPTPTLPPGHPAITSNTVPPPALR